MPGTAQEPEKSSSQEIKFGPYLGQGTRKAPSKSQKRLEIPRCSRNPTEQRERDPSPLRGKPQRGNCLSIGGIPILRDAQMLFLEPGLAPCLALSGLSTCLFRSPVHAPVCFGRSTQDSKRAGPTARTRSCHVPEREYYSISSKTTK